MPLISLQIGDRIATLQLCRPAKRNALNREMFDELEQALSRLEEDLTTTVLLIRGDERAFSAGADLDEVKNLDEDGLRAWIQRGHHIFSSLAGLPQATIGAIRGYALGGGLELALACDFRVADENAVLGFPEVSNGWIPGWGGTTRLPQLVGKARAKQLVLLAERVSAREALAMGLVHRVHPRAEFDSAVDRLARSLADKNPVAIREAKRILSHTTSCDGSPAVLSEIEGSLRCFRALSEEKMVPAHGSA